RELIAQSGPTGSSMRIESRLSGDARQQDDQIRRLYSTALRDVSAEILRTLTVDTDVTIENRPLRVQFTADPGLPDVAELTSGTWPRSVDEAAIQDAAAARLGVSAGDTLTLGTRTLTLTGTWSAPDPAAPRWFGDPAVASGAEGDAVGPVLVDESVLTGLENTPIARWTLLPSPPALGVGALGESADALARLGTEVRRLSGDDAVTLTGGLDDSIARASRATAVASGVLGLPLVLVFVAGAIVLGLIARAVASGRAAEFVLLRARGASSRALATAAAREAAATALIGATAGGLIALGALHFGLPLVGARADVAVLPALAIPAAIAALAALLGTIATITELRAPVTGRAESGRAAVVASLGPLALAAVIAGLALAQFLSLGSPVVIRSDGTVRTDPVALTAPVLVLLALALAAPAIAGPVVAVAERFARAGRGILPVLPLRQLARRARSVAAGVLVIALATGAIVLAGAFQVGATAARLHADSASTGADLRISLPVRASVEPTAPGAGAAVLTGVDGVDGAFAVLAATASMGADAVPLVAGDVQRLAGAESAPAELAALVPALTAMRGGVAVPEGARELTVTAELAPSDDVPAGLDYDVVLWMADADGAALRVPLGTAALTAGVSSVTGPVPDSARNVLAIEFRPPALPPASIVDLTLQGLQTSQGDAIAFAGASTGTLTSSKPERFLPQPGNLDPLPVVVGAGLAERLGLTIGAGLSFRVASVPPPIPATVVGILPSLPGLRDSLGLVLDLPTLEGRAVELGGSVPAANQIWVAAADPDGAVSEVRSALTVRSEIVSPGTLSSGPVLDPTIQLVGFGVAVTGMLAILGFAAVAASIGQRRRVELTPLRSLGLSAARVRGARAIELATAAVLAALLGAAAGMLTAALVVPGLTKVLA
ncbi:MAG: hypothetical protein JWP32_2539, partial [Schumannella sp.]|nr:hypothetical protein [Schumannella sp.]